MTREEAITILKDISWQMGSVKRWENIEAIDMAIEALSAEKPIVKNYDLISRADAIEATWKESSYSDPINILTEVRDRIENLPSAQPISQIVDVYARGYTDGADAVKAMAQPKGEWKHGDGNGECPYCHHERQIGWDNFCGFCGADMRGGGE